MKNTFLAVVMTLGFVASAQAQRFEDVVQAVQTNMNERDNSVDNSLDNSVDPNARVYGGGGCRVLKHSNYLLSSGQACVSCGGSAGWFAVTWQPDNNGGTVWSATPINSCYEGGM